MPTEPPPPSAPAPPAGKGDVTVDALAALAQGVVLGERFEIKRPAGSGGMATVFRAWDHATGTDVAVKVLKLFDPGNIARFQREAAALHDLRHPAIVRFVTHGVTPDGASYLVMEWLEGEDLAHRLARMGLTVSEAVVCVRRVAEALGHAHARGLVHRDVKPSNIFLEEGRVDRAKLVDFGLVRQATQTTDLTATGMLLGTPSFMAPEQARGSTAVDARTDVFALGGVLYQCLTGRRAFLAEDAAQLLAQILLEHPPRPSAIREEIPAALDALVARMLAKSPVARPADGAAVVAELEPFTAAPPTLGRRAPASEPPVGITTREKKLLSVVLLDESDRTESIAPDGDRPSGVELLASAMRVDQARSLVQQHGGHAEALGDGGLYATFAAPGTASDIAARAARCALALRAQRPKATVVLATGRGVLAETSTVGAALLTPGGEVYESALRLLMDAQATEAPRAPHRGCRIDEVTAGLLDGRFEIGGDEERLRLLGLREVAETARTLLGQETPCVARDAEIATLMATFASCVEEPRARAVLVTAGAGVGKSRLRWELLRKLQDHDDAPEVWIGRGDPMTAGAPYGIIGEAARRVCGVLSGEPLGLRQRKVRARVGRNVDPAHVGRIAAFVGEMIGTPFPPGDPHLDAARADAMLMGDQVRRAFEDWLAAESVARPQLLVLEDLHWGDLPTVNLLDGALRNLRDRPVMVLALARPEVHDLFPTLWRQRDLSEVRLTDLGARASERLVRAVLGKDVSASIVQRIVERASGNALFLEELIRSVKESGSADAMPETVLAMMTARVDALEPELRQALRAASVFGEVFWEGGVRGLLGGMGRTPQVGPALEALVQREVISARAEARFPGQREFVFRHALVREAAYAALPDGDRAVGHGLAGKWLRATGETDDAVLAEHFERGGDEAEACARWVRAAEQALVGNDLGAVMARVSNAVRCGLRGPDQATACLVLAEAHNWRGEFADAEGAALEGLELLPPDATGGALFHGLVAEAALASGVQGHRETLRRLAGKLSGVDAAEGDARAWAAVARLAEQLVILGERDLAAPLLERLDAARDGLSPAARARASSALALRELVAGNVGAHLRLSEEAAQSFEDAGDLRNACVKRERVGYARLEVGDDEGASEMLHAALATAEQMGLSNVAATARHNLGLTLSRLGRHADAVAFEGAAAAAFAAARNRRMEGASYEYLALIHLEAGDAAAAEEWARRALEVADAPPVLPLNRAESLAILARAELALGRTEIALSHAEAALTMLEDLGGIDDGESLIRLVLAQALDAAGDRRRACEAIAAARARLFLRADKIADATLRARFLRAVPDNALTLSLAEAWGVRPPSSLPPR